MAARNVILNRGQLTLQFAATPALADRLKDAAKDIKLEHFA
jgi:hypothetical protein